MDGVRVVRLWSHISHSKSKISRAATYLSFTFMALIYSFICKKPDVLYTYHPQSTTGLIGVLLKKFKKVPFITDVQDLWPDSLVATGLNKEGFVIKMIDRWCKYVYGQAKNIVVLSNGFKSKLIERGVVSEKIHVIYNWCPEENRIEKVLSSNSYTLDQSLPAQVVYAGNIGSAQSLSTLIEAVGALPKNDVELQIYGDGVEREELQKFVSTEQFDNVFFKGYLPPSKIFDVLSQADILSINLRDEELFKITIPSKLQSSMALKKPLLVAVGGEVNEIVNKSLSGVTAIPGYPISIQNALIKLLACKDEWQAMGNNAKQCYLEKFSIKVNYTKLDSLLKEVAN